MLNQTRWSTLMELPAEYCGQATAQKTSFDLYWAGNGRGGFGSQTAADPLWWPPQSLWKADCGYCDSISQNANPAALRQSVPQNGRVHLHIIDLRLGCTLLGQGICGLNWFWISEITAPVTRNSFCQRPKLPEITVSKTYGNQEIIPRQLCLCDLYITVPQSSCQKLRCCNAIVFGQMVPPGKSSKILSNSSAKQDWRTIVGYFWMRFLSLLCGDPFQTLPKPTPWRLHFLLWRQIWRVAGGGSQAPPSFRKVPGLPRKFPELLRKFFGDFPGSSLTFELNSNPKVPRKFPRLPQKFPELPRKFPGLPRRSAPFSGKPDALS